MQKTILLTNDDGVDSIGILKLKESLEEFGRVIIVAPDSQKSTTSHSFSLDKPLYLNEVSEDVYSINGFPADCVYIGINSILNHKPDLVISGINKGGNLGTDVYLSGTVSGARQGVMQGCSSMAFSLEAFNTQTLYWDTTFKVAKDIVQIYFDNTFKSFLNINIPNIDYSDIKGYKVAKMGEKEYLSQVDWRTDPRKRKYCWIGGYLTGHKDITDSDCKAVHDDYVSITPMSLDITDYGMFDLIKKVMVKK